MTRSSHHYRTIAILALAGPTGLSLGTIARAVPETATPSSKLTKTPTKAVARVVRTKNTAAAVATVAAAPQRIPLPPERQKSLMPFPPSTPFAFNGKTYYRSLLPIRGRVWTGPVIVQTIKPDGAVITVVPAPAPASNSPAVTPAGAR